MFGADISNLVDGKGHRSGTTARAADPRASVAASARGQDSTGAFPSKPAVKYYRPCFELPDGREVYYNYDGTFHSIVTPDPLELAIRRWKTEPFLPPMAIEPPKSTSLGREWIQTMSENLDRKMDKEAAAARQKRGEEADSDDDDSGEDDLAGIRTQRHLDNWLRYLDRQREAAAKKAEEREEERARKRRAREAERDARRAEREAEREKREAEREKREAAREAERAAEREKREKREAEREARRMFGVVGTMSDAAGMFSATVEVAGEMCCLGTDYLSNAAATRDAAMVVRACGGRIPDGILSEADADHADGFAHDPMLLVDKLRDKGALPDVKEVSLKSMLDGNTIKAGEATLFFTVSNTTYVADLRDDGKILLNGKTYDDPKQMVEFITDGRVRGTKKAWNAVRYGKKDGLTLNQLQQAHHHGQSSSDLVAPRARPSFHHSDKRPTHCSHCEKSLWDATKKRWQAKKGPLGLATLCMNCGTKFKMGTWVADEARPGKLKKVPIRRKKAKLG